MKLRYGKKGVIEHNNMAEASTSNQSVNEDIPEKCTHCNKDTKRTVIRFGSDDKAVSYEGNFDIKLWEKSRDYIDLLTSRFDEILESDRDIRLLYDKLYGLKLLEEFCDPDDIVYDDLYEDDGRGIQDMVADFEEFFRDSIKSKYIDRMITDRMVIYMGDNSENTLKMILNEECDTLNK